MDWIFRLQQISKNGKYKENKMNNKMVSHEDRKEMSMNSRSMVRKTSIMLLLALFLTVAIMVGTARDASAHHMIGYNDGAGCNWSHLEGVWIGQCYRAVTNTTGYIRGYFGAWENPWYWAGEYDAYHNYYYDYRGGFMSRVEHSTGLMTYPSACGWITEGTICYTGTTSAPVYAYVGPATNPTNPLIADALLEINDIWLAPNCTTSYNGC
jgi:hypothetical protein